MSHSIQRFTETPTSAVYAQLVALLQDAVADDASVGFMKPLVADLAESYWRDVFAEVAQGSRLLLVARQEGQIVGTVQLGLCGRPNGRHRAELQKLLVHTVARGQGLGQALMEAAEEEARGHGCTLLYLDTEPGKPAEDLYRKLGWGYAGEIPDYFYTTAGELKGTAFYYKRLGGG